jgi:hypothetical protein
MVIVPGAEQGKELNGAEWLPSFKVFQSEVGPNTVQWLKLGLRQG